MANRGDISDPANPDGSHASRRTLKCVPVTAVLQPSSGSEPHNQWVVEVSPGDDERYGDDLSETLSSIAEHGGGQAQVWVQSVSETTDQHVRSLGAVAYRALWQLRCPLPAAPSSIETRPFTPEDAEALVGVNNRAFSWHPEQSGMTNESLAKTMAASSATASSLAFAGRRFTQIWSRCTERSSSLDSTRQRTDRVLALQ